ncbi:hypothetical protein SAMN05216436_13124 [bacterium A37T11]|nr:hypothetical protein SAMN05216436_13124 [bacterium A37T11]
MKVKTIFIVIIAVLVTIILMKNTDEVNFWLFGDTSVPKLAVLATMFLLGLIVGFILGRPRKKTNTTTVTPPVISTPPLEINRPDHPSRLSPEDEDYIK